MSSAYNSTNSATLREIHLRSYGKKRAHASFRATNLQREAIMQPIGLATSQKDREHALQAHPQSYVIAIKTDPFVR